MLINWFSSSINFLGSCEGSIKRFVPFLKSFTIKWIFFPCLSRNLIAFVVVPLVMAGQKLRDVRHEDIPEINNPKIRFPVLEGDKLMKEVLNGGYNVHPVPPPNSEIKERIRKRYERKRIKIDKSMNNIYRI